jgi:hypothetical protein
VIECDPSPPSSRNDYFTVMVTPAEGMPLAITSRVLEPVSVPVNTSNFALSTVAPVATPMVLKPWVPRIKWSR